MSIPRRIQYTADGTTVGFDFPFRVFEEDEVAVWIDADQVEAADFAVEVMEIGGTVIFDAPPADGSVVTLVGVVEARRVTTFHQAGAFRAQVINAELDRIVAVLERLIDDQGRRLAMPETDPLAFSRLPSAAVRSGRYLSFDAEGQPIAADIVGGTPITPYMITVLDDSDAATALATLGLTAFARSLVDDADAAAARATLALGSSAVLAVQAAGAGSVLREDGDGSALTGIDLPRGYMCGLTLSNSVAYPNNDIDITAGTCRSDNGAANITLGATSKSIANNWVADETFGLDTGSKAPNTWYSLFAISKADGTASALFSAWNAVDPVMPSGYVYKRRIGWIRTDASSNIIPFRQEGDRFWWLSPRTDMSAWPGVWPGTTLTVSTPPSVVGQVHAGIWINAGSFYVDGVGIAPTWAAAAWPLLANDREHNDGSPAIGQGHVPVDNESHIRVYSYSNHGSCTLTTLGWIDRRGRDT